MEIKVPIEQLRKRKLFVATPMYGGMCHGLFTRASNDLSALAKHYGIDVKFYYLFNESLITRARNYCCDEFLRSECTHMLFIDSDIGFDANDVITMLALMDHEDPECPYDVLCAPYPKKCISWEKVAEAVNQGAADEDPGELENYVGDFVFNPIAGHTEIKLDEPAPVLEGGTGFMMFTKDPLLKMQELYPELYYTPDHVRTEHFDGSREIMAFFDAVIDNKQTAIQQEFPKYLEKNPKATHKQILKWLKEQKQKVETHKVKDEDGKVKTEHKKFSNRYLSEDYMFCQWVIKAGMSIHLCPWIKLSHTGSYVFAGSLQHLATIGVSATADPELVGKNKHM